jgi:hypothetical protein
MDETRLGALWASINDYNTLADAEGDLAAHARARSMTDDKCAKIIALND